MAHLTNICSDALAQPGPVCVCSEVGPFQTANIGTEHKSIWYQHIVAYTELNGWLLQNIMKWSVFPGTLWSSPWRKSPVSSFILRQMTQSTSSTLREELFQHSWRPSWKMNRTASWLVSFQKTKVASLKMHQKRHNYSMRIYRWRCFVLL